MNNERGSISFILFFVIQRDMNYRQKVGKFGEKIAREFLIKKGYEILATNIKISYQEIDIIAKKDKLYVFIEVKTKTSQSFGSADEAIDSGKINNLKKAMEAYSYEKKWDENFIRLDFISVDIQKTKKIAKIKHYRNIV